jgi:hypothetical protein
MAIAMDFEGRNFSATEVAAAFLPMSKARGFSLVFLVKSRPVLRFPCYIISGYTHT